jgi:hypothetical protein
MAKLPAYGPLWLVYPDYVTFPDGKEVKTLVGGAADADWITNTCAIRMSRALNYCGIPVPASFKGMHTIKGGDGKRYAFRVREMRPWLSVVLGNPDFELGKKTGVTFDKSSIAKMKGLIAFDIAFADATGHLDLWDGSAITSESHMSRDYYDSATRISLWKAG